MLSLGGGPALEPPHFFHSFARHAMSSSKKNGSFQEEAASKATPHLRGYGFRDVVQAFQPAFMEVATRRAAGLSYTCGDNGATMPTTK